MSTVSSLTSTTIVASSPVDRVEMPRSLSPCPSDSGSSRFSSSASESSNWTPAGLYIPIHRRARSSVTSATSILSSPRSSKASLQSSQHEETRQRTCSYTREELLALAPTSLVRAALRPIVTADLVAKHPRILRARGDGVARALDMARQNANSLTQQHGNFARANNSSAGAKAQTTAQVVTISPQQQRYLRLFASGDVTPSSPCIDIRSQSQSQQNQNQSSRSPSRRRGRGHRRRAQHQRNSSASDEVADAAGFRANNLVSNANAPIANANAMAFPQQQRCQGSGRQVDFTVITSWRAQQPQAEVVRAAA